MRKTGLITLIIIVGIFIAISYILTDVFFESLIEDLGTDIVGAKVEIDDFSFSLIGPEISWDRMQITNPQNTMKNMFETARCEFNMEFWPLLRGKFVIENFELSGLARNTDRETDGKIEKKKSKKTVRTSESDSSLVRTQKKLQKEKAGSASFSFSSMGNINADSIIALLDIRTLDLIDSAKNAMEQNYKKWEEKLAATDPQADVSRIQKQIESIDVNKIKSVKSFEKALSSVKEVQGSIDSLNKDFKATKKNFSADYDKSRTTLSEVDNWIKDDYARAMNMAKLPDLSAQNIGKMLFGDKIVDQINEYLGYVRTARGYLNKLSSNKKETSPPRFKGQDIYFPSPNARPDFWLQKMTIAGFLSADMPLGGTITHVTTAPKMIGKPVTINIAGSSKTREYGLQGELNYLDSIPKENFSANYSGFSLAGIPLSESKMFPKSIKNGKGVVEINFNMTGRVINIKIKFSGNQVSYAYANEKAGGKMASIVRDVFNQTTKIQVSAQVKGKPDNLQFSVKSNLDNALAKALKATASKEVEAAKQKIRKKIDNQVAEKKAQAEKIIKENKEKLQAQLDKYQDKIEEQKKILDKKKKEVEKQKDKLGKKLKDAVKNIF